MSKKTIIFIAVPLVICVNFIFYLYFFGIKTFVEDFGDQKRVSWFRDNTLLKRILYDSQNRIIHETEYESEENYTITKYHVSGKKIRQEIFENNFIKEILLFDLSGNISGKIKTPGSAKVIYDSGGFASKIAHIDPITGVTIEIKSLLSSKNQEAVEPLLQFQKPVRSVQQKQGE